MTIHSVRFGFLASLLLMLSGCSAWQSMPPSGIASSSEKPGPRAVFVVREERTEQTAATVLLTAETRFGFDQATVSDTSKQALTELVTLATVPLANLHIAITGHSDHIGPVSYNQALSARRATGVKDYLASQGVSADAISTIGAGISAPLVTCDQQTRSTLIRCLAPNRRASVELSGQRLP
ncbi:MAG TPA: OmpA family protein [Chromatiaceae bacterium]|jgi:outer membrane protein OmpA-like peptidoglycan-associated protein|nr:OmpA family protein [Chromatiaceae bacterium]HIB85161.1 OmpA family protein [Chromatiaceae bacterium]HIN81678.1 OmpA family protein [Chromatiales bacterium]